MLRIVNALLLCLLLTACAETAQKLNKLGDDIQNANKPSVNRSSRSPDYQCTQNGPFINCHPI